MNQKHLEQKWRVKQSLKPVNCGFSRVMAARNLVNSSVKTVYLCFELPCPFSGSKFDLFNAFLASDRKSVV